MAEAGQRILGILQRGEDRFAVLRLRLVARRFGLLDPRAVAAEVEEAPLQLGEPDAKDRRVRGLVLTDKGREALAATEPMRRALPGADIEATLLGSVRARTCKCGFGLLCCASCLALLIVAGLFALMG